MIDYEKYKVDIPEGKSGRWSIEHFEVSEEDAKWFNLRQAISSQARAGYRSINSGKYTGLRREGSHDYIMSDTPAEVRDHIAPVLNAKGVVLINGLGIGMVAQGCLIKDEVEKMIVVEISEDVIKLVAPHYQERFGDKFELIHADAFEYKPPKGMRYDLVWSDIWDNICADNWDEYKKLKRKYCRRCDWYGAWVEDIIKSEVRRSKQYSYGW
jgi:hypothetical protein